MPGLALGPCCCGGDLNACFHVTGCGVAQSGAVVTLRGPSPATTLVGTCTTDASGNCCIPVTTNGTYSYEVVNGRFVTATGTIIVSGGTSSVTVALALPSGYICCGKYPVPTTTFTATGPNGSASLYYNSGSGTWDGCYGYSASVRDFFSFPPCDPPIAYGGAVTALRFICGDPPVLSKTVWGCDFVGGVLRGPGANQHCNPATGVATSDGGGSSSDTGIGTGSLDPINLSFTIGGPFDAGTFTVTE